MVRELTGLEDPADGALHALWQEVLNRATLARPYEPPRGVSGYRGGERPNIQCGATTSVDFWRDNAFYCEGDRAIVFDEAWLRDFAGRYGAFAPAAILAHEWGHHVQHSFGASAYSIQAELQADCFAGMYLAASEESDPGLYIVGQDLATTLATFFEIGNKSYSQSEWFGAAEHGSPAQRMMAMGTGYLPLSSTLSATPLSAGSGLPWCYGYNEFTPNDSVEIGPYTFLNLPGRTETWQGSAYGIAADGRSGLPTSDIVLAWIETLPLAGQGATQPQLEALWGAAFPGLTPLYDLPVPPPKFGTAAARYFENRTTRADGTPLTQSGVFAVVSPSDAVGGLLIMVSRGEPAPTTTSPADLAVVQEEIAAYYQVINRLCGPDESGSTADTNLNVACLDTQ